MHVLPRHRASAWHRRVPLGHRHRGARAITLTHHRTTHATGTIAHASAHHRPHLRAPLPDSFPNGACSAPQGLEYTYDNVAITSEAAPDDSGVTVHEPYRTDPERLKVMPFRARVDLGTSRLSAKNSHKLLRALASVWIADEYDMVEHNCHHWCCAAAAALGVAPPPPWVLRTSELLKFFSGLPSEREREREQQTHRRGRESQRVHMKRGSSTSSEDEEVSEPLLVGELRITDQAQRRCSSRRSREEAADAPTLRTADRKLDRKLEIAEAGGLIPRLSPQSTSPTASRRARGTPRRSPSSPATQIAS